MRGRPTPSVAILYSEAMGYTMNLIRGLRDAGAEVTLVSWDHGRLTDFAALAELGITHHPRSSFSESGLLQLLREGRPDIVVTSGWMDGGYVAASRRYRRESGAAVVLALDTQFEYTARKLLGPLAFRLRYRHYTHCWVPGPPQYTYARLLGFDDAAILPGLLVGDASVMQPGSGTPEQRFVFAGRLAEEKNLYLLLRAHRQLPPAARAAWPLHLYGDGPLREALAAESDAAVVFHGFVQPAALGAELGRGGVLVLPSRYEPWGVIVHEACQAGLSLLLSDRVGAASTFLLDGGNGRRFSPRRPGELAERMRGYVRDGTERLTRERTLSIRLGRRVELATSAAALLSARPNTPPS